MDHTTANNIVNASPSSTTDRSTAKRRKRTDDHHQALIPGLPDHIAHLCLSYLPPAILYSVCRSWRRLIYSSPFPPVLSIYALLLPTKNNTDRQTHLISNSLQFSSFDPISSTWHSLPPPPPDPVLRLLLRHPSFISRNLPIQSVAVLGRLILLAATTDDFRPALSHPVIFNTLTQRWSFGPPLANPRRWCAAGASRGTVYMASGIGSQYSPEVARSVEKWDLKNSYSDLLCERRSRNSTIEEGWKWEKMGGLRDGKLSREAIDAVGWRKKLCMVNVKGAVAKQGMVYDVDKDVWEDMPEGMLAGWRGPAAAMDEETIYVADESKGVLKLYDHERDGWVEVLESEKLKGAESMAAGGGRVCVVSGGGFEVVVIDVVASPPRLWVVDTPPGFHALAIHVLPRMSHPD